MTNVIVQVVERHIADGLEEVFHDKRVRNLNDTEIKRMLEDDYDVRIARRELKEQEAILSKGLEICAQIGLRSDLGPVSYCAILCSVHSYAFITYICPNCCILIVREPESIFSVQR